MAEKGELDLTGARLNRGLWLVKVPKYLAHQWEKASGRCEVGKLSITKGQGKPQVSFSLNEELAVFHSTSIKTPVVATPRHHDFSIQTGGQSLGVFTKGPSDKLSFEGIVVQKADCQPCRNDAYMKLKRIHMEQSAKPVRLSQQLDKAITTNYLPVSNHQYNIEFERRKKEEGKRARADKQQTYLKDILREIGIYNVKGTHKNTWELKPEYRHYHIDEKTDD
uniref:general transcription factor IIF subunit 2 isoform X2 n=1 Tax=Myxine glutinosa TaxID=7769 RepID=UPI0035900CC1